ncbi:hypothetical protein ACIOC1_09430 [Streptomyces sp. NPDC088197]|uniref:hypothetical protein n=1 Tax=Streptomyces sp. NPDC088197 TaxID=3365840 RepID=UPI0038305FF3
MDDSQTAHYLEMWKQTIAVQQHFNDIEWRIRGFALTALTFTLGAAAVSARDGSAIKLAGQEIQLSSTISLLGLILWGAFYFVDQIWYHRLLIGAVQHGTALEKELQARLPKAGLTMEISASSPYPASIRLGSYRRSWSLHSARKLTIFYLIGASVLLVFAIALQLGA